MECQNRTLVVAYCALSTNDQGLCYTGKRSCFRSWAGGAAMMPTLTGGLKRRWASAVLTGQCGKYKPCGQHVSTRQPAAVTTRGPLPAGVYLPAGTSGPLPAGEHRAPNVSRRSFANASRPAGSYERREACFGMKCNFVCYYSYHFYIN